VAGAPVGNGLGDGTGACVAVGASVGLCVGLWCVGDGEAVPVWLRVGLGEGLLVWLAVGRGEAVAVPVCVPVDDADDEGTAGWVPDDEVVQAETIAETRTAKRTPLTAGGSVLAAVPVVKMRTFIEASLYARLGNGHIGKPVGGTGMQ
jgi:hypothetical protein